MVSCGFFGVIIRLKIIVYNTIVFVTVDRAWSDVLEEGVGTSEAGTVLNSSHSSLVDYPH